MSDDHIYHVAPSCRLNPTGEIERPWVVYEDGKPLMLTCTRDEVRMELKRLRHEVSRDLPIREPLDAYVSAVKMTVQRLAAVGVPIPPIAVDWRRTVERCFHQHFTIAEATATLLSESYRRKT